MYALLAGNGAKGPEVPPGANFLGGPEAFPCLKKFTFEPLPAVAAVHNPGEDRA
jgi:hypothetical protein